MNDHPDFAASPTTEDAVAYLAGLVEAVTDYLADRDHGALQWAMGEAIGFLAWEKQQRARNSSGVVQDEFWSSMAAESNLAMTENLSMPQGFQGEAA